jgi:hypothetical protein
VSEEQQRFQAARFPGEAGDADGGGLAGEAELLAVVVGEGGGGLGGNMGKLIIMHLL